MQGRGVGPTSWCLPRVPVICNSALGGGTIASTASPDLECLIAVEDESIVKQHAAERHFRVF